MTISQQRSLIGRAATAVALLLGFYLLALGIAGGLVALMVVSVAEGRAGFWFLPAALTVYAILRGLFFLERTDAKPTGILADARSEPSLLELVNEVARSMGTKPPDAVYLIPDVNAFVFEQGRLLGLVRTKRVMGIGLALVSVLNRDQLKAVLAHEFGHYVGGDTRIGGLVYRARASIERTIVQFEAGFLRRVFSAYARLFLRITQRIARDQELAADAAAVRVGGRDAHTGALLAVVGAGAAFDAFMEEYVVPLWHADRFPDNLYSGFRAFLDDPERREQVAGYVEAVKLREDEYGSHPSLARRLESIGRDEAGADPDPRSARDLLVHPDTSERQMSRVVAQAAAPDRTLSAIAWEDTGSLRAARAREAADAFMDALGAEGVGVEGDRLPRVVLVLERADANKIVRQLLPLRDYPPEAIDGVVDEAIHYYVAATMATDLIERQGYLMELSWTKPFLLVSSDGNILDVGDRVGKALAQRNLRSLLIVR